MSYIGTSGTYEKIVPGDVATGISLEVRSPISGDFKGLSAISAIITVENNDIHYTLHGVDPTAAAGTDIGHLASAGDSFTINGVEDVKRFRVIDNVSGSASTVKVTCIF